MAYNLTGTIEENKREAERIYAVAKAITVDPKAADEEAQKRADNYYTLNGKWLTGHPETDVATMRETILEAAPKVAQLRSAWRIDGDMLIVCTLTPDARSGQVETPLTQIS